MGATTGDEEAAPAGVRYKLADGAWVERLRPLWLALHRHHRQVASYGPLLADERASWERRRRRYQQALAAGEGILAVATTAEGLVGYAFVVLRQGPDDTFAYDGDRDAELFTLSVAPHARGQGIGGRLCDLVEAELVARGVTELEVAVMAGNREALRFYRRRGYRPSEELLRRPLTPRR